MILYKFGFRALFPGESPADSREFHFYPPINQPPVPRCRKEPCSLGSAGPCWEEEGLGRGGASPSTLRGTGRHNACTKSGPDLPVQDGPESEALCETKLKPLRQRQASAPEAPIQLWCFKRLSFCLCSIWWHQDFTHLEGLWMSFLFCFIYLFT